MYIWKVYALYTINSPQKLIVEHLYAYQQPGV